MVVYAVQDCGEIGDVLHATFVAAITLNGEIRPLFL